MEMFSIAKKDTLPYMIGLILILVANVCFFDVKTLSYLFVCSGIGMVLIFGAIFLKRPGRLIVDPGVKYLTVVYIMIFLNGFFRCRMGEFNWDAIFFNYVEYIAIYIAFKMLMSINGKYVLINKSIIIATLVIIGYILAMEMNSIVVGSVRIGDSLAGNVNSVGIALGIMSIFISYNFCCAHKVRILFMWIVTVAMMLLTGSKKTVFYIGLDLMMFFLSTNGKRRYQRFIFVVILAVSFGLIIMNVPMFYDIIGFRIEDMLKQLLGNSSVHVSYSTEVRAKMIIEGTQIFWDHPIMGGGERYFGSKTINGYDYSHCNYIEILCNFGLVGMLIYYLPYLSKLIEVINLKGINVEKKSLLIILIMSVLVIDWMAVSYTSYTMYIPIIFVFACLTVEKKKRRNGNVEIEND